MSTRGEQIGSAPAYVGRAGRPHRFAGLLASGLLASGAAIAVTTLVAALGGRLGVDFEVPDGGESIPLAGFAFVTGVFSVVGIALAAALLRFSSRPVHHFVVTTVLLTALSLVPALFSGAEATTVSTLVLLHLVAASVVIPVLARALSAREG